MESDAKECGTAAAHPPPPRFAAHRDALLGLARSSVRHGLANGRPLRADPARFPAALRKPGASFVTLERDGALRGCTGSLEAERALVVDIAHNAFTSAFRDPRFEPVTRAELADLVFRLAILGPQEVLPHETEAELLSALRPGIDGLVLQEGSRRATFLPAVWQSLPDPADFLQQLRQKAGLPADYWSPGLRCLRYTVESIDEF